ncbi:restriction endonuclease subunit S [Escherichia coli]
MFILTPHQNMEQPYENFVTLASSHIPEWSWLALTEPLLLERASKHAVGLTVKHLRVGDVETLNIPLPPLNEQYRIVAKVKILLSLCDKAQKKIKSAQQTQLHLADALTEAAIN